MAKQYSRRLLLVDDDPLARRAASRVLRHRLNAEVVEAQGGMQALSLWRRVLTGFDVAIIDLDMPEMDGVELLHRFARLDPGLPVVVWSGRPLEPPPAELAPAIALVSKQDDVYALLNAVGRVLDSRRSGARVRPCLRSADEGDALRKLKT